MRGYTFNGSGNQAATDIEAAPGIGNKLILRRVEFSAIGGQVVVRLYSGATLKRQYWCQEGMVRDIYDLEVDCGDDEALRFSVEAAIGAVWMLNVDVS